MEENKVLDIDENIENTEDYNSEDILNEITVQEELKRIDLQDSPKSKLPKEIKNSNIYKESMEQAYTIGECFQILINYGIDYTNAVAISSNLLTNRTNLEMSKVQATNNEQQL